MRSNKVFVFDTNALISAHLIEGSVSDRALRKALEIGVTALSEDLLTEVTEVIYRPKFDKYFNSQEEKDLVLEKIQNFSRFFSVVEIIQVSTDPDDNMILELAIACKASAIITGDPHLLSLHPFQN